MSLTKCIECGAIIDTDEYPEAYTLEYEDGRTQDNDYAVCEGCQDDFQDLNKYAQIKEFLRWNLRFEQWMKRGLRQS